MLSAVNSSLNSINFARSESCPSSPEPFKQASPAAAGLSDGAKHAVTHNLNVVSAAIPVRTKPRKIPKSFAMLAFLLLGPILGNSCRIPGDITMPTGTPSSTINPTATTLPTSTPTPNITLTPTATPVPTQRTIWGSLLEMLKVLYPPLESQFSPNANTFSFTSIDPNNLKNIFKKEYLFRSAEGNVINLDYKSNAASNSPAVHATLTDYGTYLEFQTEDDPEYLTRYFIQNNQVVAKKINIQKPIIETNILKYDKLNNKILVRDGTDSKTVCEYTNFLLEFVTQTVAKATKKFKTVGEMANLENIGRSAFRALG